MQCGDRHDAGSGSWLPPASGGWEGVEAWSRAGGRGAHVCSHGVSRGALAPPSPLLGSGRAGGQAGSSAIRRRVASCGGRARSSTIWSPPRATSHAALPMDDGTGATTRSTGSTTPLVLFFTAVLCPRARIQGGREPEASPDYRTTGGLLSRTIRPCLLPVADLPEVLSGHPLAFWTREFSGELAPPSQRHQPGRTSLIWQIVLNPEGPGSHCCCKTTW